MSLFDNLTEEQQAYLIELTHQKFLTNSLHQQSTRIILQKENIINDDNNKNKDIETSTWLEDCDYTNELWLHNQRRKIETIEEKIEENIEEDRDE